MSSPEQFKLIMEGGVRAWNERREKNPEVRPDLEAADLVRATLPGVNLRKANFRRACLRTANLHAADRPE